MTNQKRTDLENWMLANRVPYDLYQEYRTMAAIVGAKEATAAMPDAALYDLEQAVITYAEAARNRGNVPKAHMGKLKQIAHLVDNWLTDYLENSP